MKIRTKFGITFLLIILTIAFIGYQSYSSFLNMETQSDNIVLDAIPISQAADNLLTDLINEETGVRGYLVTGQESFLAPYNTGKQSLAKDLATIRAHEAKHPIMKDLVENKAFPLTSKMDSFFQNEISMMKAGSITEARQMIDYGKADMDAFRQVHQLIQQDNAKLTNDSWQTTKGVSKRSRTLIIIGIVIAILVAIVAGALLTRSIVRPISLVNKQLKEIAEGEGDLTRELSIKSNDEIGSLANSFNLMLQNLRNLIGQVTSTAVQVAASSEELTASAEQTSKATEQVALISEELAAGSEKQVVSVKQSVQIMHEMSDAIKEIAANSQTVSSSAVQAASKAQEGNRTIRTAISQMNSIHGTVKQIAEVVEGLGEHSQAIGHIVEVITGIASQTNLLALNAAIEAARAGEHGRGFAVVADEVRKLAEQSSNSAQQIAELIQTIQIETAKAVQAMEAGTQEVEEGISAVDTAGHSFEQIQQTIQQVTSQIQEVSSSAQQISASTAQVAAAFHSISEVTEISAAGTQNVSAAAEEQLASMEEITSSANALSSMAEELQALVGKFKV